VFRSKYRPNITYTEEWMRDETDYMEKMKAECAANNTLPAEEGEYELRAALCVALMTAKNRLLPLKERKAAIRSLLAEHLKKS
jgi:hypothetical protein